MKMTEHQRKEVASAPVKYRGIMERAYTAEAPPRGAIKAACLRCIGYLRADITNCTSRTCPLWHHRPYQNGEEDDAPDAEGSVSATQDALEAVS